MAFRETLVWRLMQCPSNCLLKYLIIAVLFFRTYTLWYVCSFCHHTKNQGYRNFLWAFIIYLLGGLLPVSHILYPLTGYIMQAPLRLNLTLSLFCLKPLDAHLLFRSPLDGCPVFLGVQTSPHHVLMLQSRLIWDRLHWLFGVVERIHFSLLYILWCSF